MESKKTSDSKPKPQLRLVKVTDESMPQKPSPSNGSAIKAMRSTLGRQLQAFADDLDLKIEEIMRS